jgi:hypothetical protein
MQAWLSLLQPHWQRGIEIMSCDNDIYKGETLQLLNLLKSPLLPRLFLEAAYPKVLVLDWGEIEGN